MLRLAHTYELQEASNITVTREYGAKNLQVPGVPTADCAMPWPAFTESTGDGNTWTTNSGGYNMCRRFILQNYATRWLRALHDQDPEFYAQLLFKSCAELADEVETFDNLGALAIDGENGKLVRHL